MELRLGREHTDTVSDGAGDIAGLLVHSRVHDLVCGDADVLANGELAGTAHLKALPVIGCGGRKEGVGLHREAEAHALAEDVGNLVEALPELAHIEDKGRCAVFLGNLEKLAVVHVTSSENETKVTRRVLSHSISRSAWRSILPFLVRGMPSSCRILLGTMYCGRDALSASARASLSQEPA